MILKLQRAVFDDADIFFYNADRSVLGFTPETPDLMELFGSKYRIFIEAEVSDDLNKFEVIEVLGADKGFH